MKISMETATPTLGPLARAIEADPASWEDWTAIHLALSASLPQEGLESALPLMLGYIRHRLRSMDGTACICPDHDLILLCRYAEPHILHRLVQELFDLLDEQGELARQYSLYQLGSQWGEMVALCEQKSAHPNRMETAYVFDTEGLFADIGKYQKVIESGMLKRQQRSHPTVLLVEDDELTRRLVSKVLHGQCTLVVADDIQSAVKQYMLNLPDLVFLDISLPDGSGLQVLQELMTCDPEARTVMFSSNSQLENLVEALNMGAEGFIAKPFRKEQMLYYLNFARGEMVANA